MIIDTIYIPTATEKAGISSKTILHAPICAPSPILMFPNKVAPAPSKTPVNNNGRKN